MSINRPKRVSRKSEGSAKSASSSTTPKPPKWKDVVEDQPEKAFVPYSSASTFAKDTLVAHAKFGKGVVLEVEGNKINILFEEGIRKLMHGTPPN